MKKLLALFVLLVWQFAFSQVKVVATTTVIYDLVKEIGKDKVKADFLCRGDQDPHFLEVMPSYMVKLRNADIMFKIGLGLEMWSQQLLDGARNNKIKVIDLSEKISKLEVPSGKVDASHGDVHPNGNPHYWLDPENGKIMAKEICYSLCNISKENSDYFNKNLKEYLNKLDSKIKEWKVKMASAKGQPFVFFHSSWVYFTGRYGINTIGFVEPKPGISPSPQHNSEIINIIKRNKAKYLVMENFYSDSAPNLISKNTGVKVIKVPTGVYGMDGINSYIQMMDYIIKKVTS